MRCVEAGKSGGGICYGYDVVKLHDDAGERIRSEREIDAAEAEIVRRIFREFAQGSSPRAIARRLNEDAIPGPKGKLWTDSVLRGHSKRGTGLLNNELYIGRLVWNRQRFMKNPATGKRVSRVNPPEEWIVAEVPELRIVDDGLWQAAKARQGGISEKYATAIAATRAARANYLNSTHRPRYLLSGLLECGVCGGPYSKRGQRPDAGDLRDPPARGVAAMPQLYPPLDLADLSVEPGHAFPLLAQGLDDHCRQPLGQPLQDRANPTGNAGSARCMTSPYSVSRPRRPFIWAVRNFTSCWRMRCSARTACCSSLLIATILTPGCCAAVQIACASRASFLLPFAKGRTALAGNSRTQCPSSRSRRTR